jgi:hypothetical protein
VAGNDPRGAALEHGHLGADLGQARHELDGRRARADDGHTLSGELNVVPPAGRVEQVTREGLDARQLGDARLGQSPGGKHHGIRRQAPATRRDSPHRPLVVPAETRHRGAEAQVGFEPLGAHRRLEVGVDLGTARENTRPVRVRQKLVAVEMGWHVARHPGVGVVTPGAAHPLGALEQHKRLLAAAAQGDGRADTREAGADDRHAHVCHRSFLAAGGSP